MNVVSEGTLPTILNLIILEQKSYQQPPPRCLQVGVKVQHPSYVPAHLPAFPDPHTYIRTPVRFGRAPHMGWREVELN